MLYADKRALETNLKACLASAWCARALFRVGNAQRWRRCRYSPFGRRS